MSGCALLCTSQSVVGGLRQAHGYKAGTVTKVIWLSEEKAAGPEGSLRWVCLPALRQYLHTELEKSTQSRDRDVHCVDRKNKNISLQPRWQLWEIALRHSVALRG